MAYCSRCEKSFPHSQAKRQHITDSPRHHVCYWCPSEPDHESEDDLDEHLELAHNICVHCSRKLDSPSNLKNHLKIHAEKGIECPGCDAKSFACESAMLLHLEAGSCESGRDLDFVNDVASKCRQSDSYKSNNPDFDFQCPTCKTLFSFMSGLLQHAESDACEEDVQQKPLGQFINYLWSRI